MKLKICQIRSASSGEELAALGVDFLGFHVLDESLVDKRASLLAANRRLAETGFEGGVLLTRSRDHGWITAAAEEGHFSLVQVHRFASVGEIADLSGRLRKVGAGVVQVVDPRDQSLEYVTSILNDVEYVLYDNYVGGTGERFVDEDLAGLPMERAFIAGGIDADRALALRRKFRPFGVDVQSWVKRPDKTKDLDRVIRLVSVCEGRR